MTSHSEVASALDLLGCNNPTQADVGKFSSYTTNLVDTLFKGSSFSTGQNHVAREAVKTTHAKDSKKLSFFLALSDALKLDESKAESAWEQVRKEVPAALTAEITTLENLLSIREVVSSQRSQLWSLLHEIIRIDLDSQHSLHATVSSVLDTILSRDLVGEVIKYLLQTLPAWSPSHIDRALLSSFPDHEVSKYIQSVHQAWAVDYLEEHKCALDTLVLLSYSRQNLNLSELKEVLTKFFAQSLNTTSNSALQTLLIHSMRSDLLKIEAELQAVNFRYIVLFSGCFQFWRLFQADLASQRDHPLLLPSTPDYSADTAAKKSTSADKIFESLQGITEALQKAAAAQARLIGISTQGASTGDTLVRSFSQSGVLVPFNPAQDSPAARIVLYLWQCFLKSFSECTIVGAEYVTTQTFEKFQSLATSFEIMEDLSSIVVAALSGSSKLAQRVSLDPAQDGSLPQLSSEPNMFIYCSILQELTNVLILAHTLRDESSVLDLGPVTSLVEATYRSQSALCGGFWAAWVEASETQLGTDVPVEHYYPLCRLVQTLLATTPHDPVYLFKILSSLACSPQACMTVLDILNQAVHIIDYERFSRLQFREPQDDHMFGAYETLQWDSIVPWLREHGDIPPGTLVMKINPDTVNVSSRGQGLWSGKDAGDSTDSLNWYNKSTRAPKTAPAHVPHVDSIVLVERVGLCTPSDRSQGVVVDVDAATKRCLVRWDTQSLWWTLAIDLLMKYAGPTGSAADSHVALQALLDLLNALFKQGSVVAFFLETKWNEIALLSLLQDIKHPELFSLLSQNNVRISSLRVDPAAAFDRLHHDLGIAQSVSEQVVSKLVSPNTAEFALYELSFAQLLSKAVLSLLQVSVSNASSPLLLTAWSMFVTISEVSSEWAEALAVQSVAYFPSARGAGGVYEHLYATVSTASTTSALPEVFYLASQHLIKRCVERRAEAGATPIRVLFDSLDIKKNGYVSPTDIAHGFSVRGYHITPSSLAEILEQAGLSGFRNLDYSDFYRLTTGIDVREKASQTSNSAGPLYAFRQAVLRIAKVTKELNSVSDEGHTRSAGIFVLNQFNHLYRSPTIVGTSPEETCFLLLKSVQAIEALLSAEQALVTYIVENIASNVAFLEALVHLSVLLSVLSTQSTSGAGSGRPTTFKDLLSILPGAATATAGGGAQGVLPLDFTTAVGSALPPLVRESLIHISSVSTTILSKLAQFSTSKCASSSPTEKRLAENLLALLAAQSPERLNGLGWVTSLMGVQSGDSPNAPRTIAATALRGSNLCLLFSALDLPSSAAPSEVVFGYKLEVTRLLVQVVNLMPTGPGRSNISDCVSGENITAAALALCASIRAEGARQSHLVPLIQTATLKFLLAVAQKQPAALCLFLSAQKSSCSGSNGDLLDALLTLLASADHLYAQEPESLHILYTLFIRICKASEFHILVKSTLVMIQSKKFWDYVTAPLMLDVPAVPSLQTHYQPYSDRLWADSVLRSHHGFADQAVSALEKEVTEYVSSTGLAGVEAETALHCHRLHCHAAALELLSIERYGKFYEFDAAVALLLTKKMQAFYVKATESHRFISWIKHYLLISVDKAAAGSVEELSAVLGINALPPSAEGVYGASYKLPAEFVSTRMESTYRRAAVQNLEVDGSDRVDLYLLAKYKSELVNYNLSSSLADSALNLIHSWRQFLEFYVLPGSSAKQHEHKERSNSTDGGTTTPNRGRKHSFDGDDIDGAASTSPQVGTLSPVTTATQTASPTAAKGSSFSGDKRSYEVVSEVMNQLECHQTDGYMGTEVGRRAIAEKCELLVSMVHHQLKVVTTRTSDPSKSVILTRDLGSLRLTQDKMERLLEKLDDFYRDLIFEPTAASGAAGLDSTSELKSTIALRILTAIMLLLNSIFTFNSADEVHSKPSMRRRSLYKYAVTALKNLAQTHGRTVFSNTSALTVVGLNNTNGDAPQEESKAPAPETRPPTAADRLSTEQAIAQVSLQIMKLAVPRSSSAEPLISLTDNATWRDLLRETGAITLLTQVVSELSAATGDMPQWDHVYAGWRTAELEVGSRGGSECSPPRFVEQRRIDARVYAEAKCMLMSLLSAIEALMSGISANIITVQNTTQLITLLQTLIGAPLLRNFQEVILAQPEELTAVLMGYNAVTTDVSLVATCWMRVINLIESLIVRIGDTPSNIALRVSEAQQEIAGAASSRQELHNTLCGFLRTYVDLLLLPMRPASHRYSVQQLSFTRAAFNLFSAVNAKMPLWKVTLPTLHPEVSARASSLLRVFSLLLWHGEDMETLEQQRRLLAHCVAVSKTEKREERSTQIRKLRKRSGSQGNASRLASGSTSTGSPQHVHFGATTVLGAGASIMKDTAAAAVSSSGKGRKPMGYYSSLRGGLHSGGGDNGATEGVQHSMVEFLLDIEAHMIAAMAPLSAYIRQITPIPMEVSKYDEFGHPLFPLGNRVFYFSDQIDGGLMEGIVARLHPSGDRFDVVLLDDMVECDVHASQVRFTAAPIVQYQSISDLAKHSIEDLSTTAMFYHGHAELSNALSTAHLLRSLQLATSAVTGSRMQNQQLYPQAGQDLVTLAGQLAWLVVSNIAHHALVPMGREVSMIHQLNDLKRAIRPRDSAHSGLGSSSTGNTSPFTPYLDQRERGHVTPLTGISSTPAAGATSAYLKWMHTPEWSQYVNFIDKWCEEIFYILGRGATLVTAEEEEEEESPSARIRKKRVGLRARIEWVQSPEEV